MICRPCGKLQCVSTCRRRWVCPTRGSDSGCCSPSPTPSTSTDGAVCCRANEGAETGLLSSSSAIRASRGSSLSSALSTRSCRCPACVSQIRSLRLQLLAVHTALSAPRVPCVEALSTSNAGVGQQSQQRLQSTVVDGSMPCLQQHFRLRLSLIADKKLPSGAAGCVYPNMRAHSGRCTIGGAGNKHEHPL
eukprot:SAG31_NODE_1998_length_6696_cov_7.606943_1_plen_191_part_00